MAGVDFTFNLVLGKARYYLELPAANDGLFLALLDLTGLEADATLRDYDTLSALLAGPSNELTFTGYSRKVVAPSAATIDDANERVDVDAADVSSYTNTGGASQQAGKALLCYDPDTTAGDDTTVIPIFAWNATVTFDVGVPVTLPFDPAGMVRFTN